MPGYDAADRLTHVEHRPSAASPPTAAFARFGYTYHPAGNRLTQVDYDPSRSPAQTTQEFEYDRLHRLVRETPRAGIATVPNAYGYVKAGSRVGTGSGQALVEDPPSAVLTYSSGWSQTTNASASGGTYRGTTQLNAYADFSFTGNAVSVTYVAWDQAGIMRVTLNPGGPSPVVLGEFDQCSPTTKWQQVRTFSGFANGAHVVRLSKVGSTCGGQQQVTVDAVRAYSEAKAYQYDDDNRLKQVTEGGQATTFQYDRNGSATKKTAGPDVTGYGYDGARRLVNVALNGQVQAGFTYDGDGARTGKVAGGQTTTYVNDARGLTTVLQETKAGNTLSHVPGLSQYDPSQPTEASKWSYFHGDAQNNRALTDNTGSVTRRWEYDPFGVLRTTSGTANSDFQYGGEQRDAETGLINLRARYYDPALGRFLQRDVLYGHDGLPQTFNRYQYGLNNPLRFVDPSGYDDDSHSDNHDPSAGNDYSGYDSSGWSDNSCGCEGWSDNGGSDGGSDGNWSDNESPTDCCAADDNPSPDDFSSYEADVDSPFEQDYQSDLDNVTHETLDELLDLTGDLLAALDPSGAPPAAPDWTAPSGMGVLDGALFAQVDGFDVPLSLG